MGLCLLPAACSNDDPAGPAPYDGPTFAEIWPAAVGHTWTFELVDRTHYDGSPTYENRGDVPDLPTMEDLRRDMSYALGGTVIEVNHGHWSLEVTADATVDPDTTLLSLETTVTPSAGYPSNPLGLTPGPTLQLTKDRVAVRREDDLVWVHLDGALTAGHEFATSLQWGFASTYDLTVRVWQTGSHAGRDTTYADCVETFYVFDMGVLESLDENGDSLGFFRASLWGTVVYAAGIGPVYCLERGYLGPGILVQREAVLVERAPDD
ncbi:MAG: hypothetical protein GY838_15160 [bacterium]|nr:hypothetical protein [bacterium]